MKQMKVGEVVISIQDESDPNEDVFMINTHFFDPVDLWHGNIGRIPWNEIEDPECFVVYSNRNSQDICTKQPDAALQLALYLNEIKGIHVGEGEIHRVREQLIEVVSRSERDAEGGR